MAGWTNFNAATGRTGTKLAQTVTETLYPAAIAVYNAEGWDNPTRLIAAVVSVSAHCKVSEFPLLRDDEDRLEAVMAGEYWANSQFHTGVNRFQTQNEAWDWVFMHYPRRTYPLNAVCRERLVQAYDQEIFADNILVLNVQNIIRAAYFHIEVIGDPPTGLQALCNYVCGLSKMGTAARSWIRGKLGALRTECDNPDLELTTKSFECVWEYYGRAYCPTALQWPMLFKSIQQQCNGQALIRLATTAQFAAGHGAAVTQIIKDAMTHASDFDWGIFNREPRTAPCAKINAEIALWHADIVRIEANPWLMFQPATKGASQTMMNLGYLAKQLLIVCGVHSVQEYKGLNPRR